MLFRSFLEQLPEQCRVESVRAAWRELWAKALTFLSSSQMHRLGKAFVFAARAHADQKRVAGDPYVIHTLRTASILADMQLDLATLTAARYPRPAGRRAARRAWSVPHPGPRTPSSDQTTQTPSQERERDRIQPVDLQMEKIGRAHV